MDFIHKLILYGALGFLGFSLVLPGLYEVIKTIPGDDALTPATVAAKNQLRALYGMMVGLGVMAFRIGFNLEQSRNSVIAVGIILLMVAAARLYSLVVDGFPGAMAWVYLIIELLLGSLFIIWPPSR